jgi:hypothetical protein
MAFRAIFEIRTFNNANLESGHKQIEICLPREVTYRSFEARKKEIDAVEMTSHIGDRRHGCVKDMMVEEWLAYYPLGTAKRSVFCSILLRAAKRLRG